MMLKLKKLFLFRLLPAIMGLTKKKIVCERGICQEPREDNFLLLKCNPCG